MLDENKKTLLKAKTKERVLKKQESFLIFMTSEFNNFFIGEIDPKIVPKEKNKVYDPTKTKHKT